MGYVLTEPRTARIFVPMRFGLGDPTGAAQGVQIGGALAAPITTGILASGAAAAGPGAMILGMSATAAIPIIGAAIAGVTILATYLIKNSGCGQTCIVTSQWANQAEPILQKNLQAYFSNPAPRTTSQQAAALANFDAIWARLVEMCSDPSVGNAGKRCISDRQSGACTWKQTSNSPLLQFPGEPQPGECWNWFNGYRDPIANDAVTDSPVANLESQVSGALGISQSSALPILIIGALVLGAMAL